MAHILHLTASPRAEASYSRRISTELVEAWCAAHPGTKVTERDIGHETIPPLSEEVIGAFYTPVGDRTPSQHSLMALSDELVSELLEADIYVLSMPMYNFNVPAVFKAYIDQVVRIGVTVSENWEGLLEGKKSVIITARGGEGYGVGEFRESYNFEDPYLRTVMDLLGVTNLEFIHIPSTAYPEKAKASMSAARSRFASVIP